VAGAIVKRLLPNKKQTAAAEVRRWLRSTDRTWLCSFIPICEHLGFDPDAVRAAILRHGVPPGFRHANAGHRGPWRGIGR
jgi:hypothetical protein